MPTIPQRRRRVALLATTALVAGLLAITVGGTPAGAGTQTVTNACRSSATAGWSDIDFTLSGTASVNPATLGTPFTVSGASIQANIPATILISGYNLGLLVVGSNNIPTNVWVARSATNVDIGGGTPGTLTQVDPLSFIATTVIADPDGAPATGDETATPIVINQPLPNMTVTPTGGTVVFRQANPGSLPPFAPGVVGPTAITPLGSIYTSSSVAGGLIRANFDCQPGVADADGPDNIPGNADDGTTFTPAAPGSWPGFESVTVNAPSTAPVCTSESASVGVGQSIPIDLNDNCTDVNGNIDPTTFTVTAPAAGTLTPTGNGTYTYDAPATDPGAPVTIDFTVADTTGFVSNTATVTINILANQCEATLSSCSLNEIIVQPVVGTTMTMDKVPGTVNMTTVVLDGNAQVSSGAIQSITVTNARGTAAGWGVTGYSTDLGAPGGPTIDLTPLGFPGVVVPACSPEGSFNLSPAHHRLCIPGNNLAWAPSAAIIHEVIYGDVAQVGAGPALATSASDWRSQLVAAGNANAGGLGGLGATNSLCSAPMDHSGGTFKCDAALYLGVPASAGAGVYTGGLVLTLL